jgi:hypothetical protein
VLSPTVETVSEISRKGRPDGDKESVEFVSNETDQPLALIRGAIILLPSKNEAVHGV